MQKKRGHLSGENWGAETAQNKKLSSGKPLASFPLCLSHSRPLFSFIFPDPEPFLLLHYDVHAMGERGNLSVKSYGFETPCRCKWRGLSNASLCHSEPLSIKPSHSSHARCLLAVGHSVYVSVSASLDHVWFFMMSLRLLVHKVR